eukprot:TRINITY_DN6858_c0_g1_i1.p1 TRINITY_DN6858_c0_g1~~TRINITY_DN6858_c0_g1_i1.p1  ORF type:complete len:459 (-),score=84.30 TRINITY_DN6858_c0_g1_i1:93-1469(-)
MERDILDIISKNEDNLARIFWKKYFTQDDKILHIVEFNHFIECITHIASLNGITLSRKHLSQITRLLTVYVEDQKNVKIEFFSKIIKSFGPFQFPKFLENIKVIDNVWFFGGIPTDQADVMLDNCKENHSFLVRYSTKNDTGNFVLSVVRIKGEERRINSIHIEHEPESEEFALSQDELAEEYKRLSIKSFSTLGDLINNLSKSLHLETAIPPPDDNDINLSNSEPLTSHKTSPYRLETFTSSSAESDTLSTDSEDLDLDMNQGISWKKKTQYVDKLFKNIKKSKDTILIPFSELFQLVKKKSPKDLKSILSKDRLRFPPDQTDWNLLQCLSHQRYARILPTKLILPELITWLKNNSNFVFQGKPLHTYIPSNTTWEKEIEILEKNKKGNLLTLIAFLHTYPDVKILLYTCNEDQDKRSCTVLEREIVNENAKDITLMLGYLGGNSFVSLIPKGALSK